ncbi:FecR domain-containing protein [Mucilaginibacter sp. cycad4]|uniref:FecR family protein n=1 Tax=Mucilaginibacter sp. cycad4 TaxID=3342096 RepID=UPI002AABEE1C|nr:FecR domain-containing protein [Mucilaginibacter gossypii]WPU99037.1 FecR domain-containing protein [Mucilaginibacter gossypii]
MNDPQRRILDLLEKFHNGTADTEELGELDRWYASFDNDPKLTAGYSKEKLTATREGMLRNIRKSTETDVYVPKKRKMLSRNGLISIAAVSVIVAAFFVYRTAPVLNETSSKLDVMPGKDVAILTLSTGKQIDLNLAKNGRIYSDKGLDIIKESNGVLRYRSKPTPGHDSQEMNTLTTPSGGQFKVVLADGTKIWLNAMSSLTYPSRFSGHKRPVSLTGEAYFEVARNKEKPFDVNTVNERVEVLGTHFNISAYTDERSQRTTLLEGSVRVTAKRQIAQVTIKPGQQAEGTAGSLKITNVDANATASWKDGVFIFNHTETHTLMRQLSRWYNIDVVYQGDIKERTFSGSIDRSYTLLQVLDVLKISKVNFKIERPNGANNRSRLTLIP